MATEKLVNYTPEMTAELVETYVAEPTQETVKALAEKFGRTVKSIVAKLAREGVYQKAEKGTGKRDMLKSELVAEIAKLVRVNEEVLESLEKATGPALRYVLNAMRADHARIEQLIAERDAKAE